MGVELLEPITTELSRNANFANEGGYNYRYRYLKNIMGLWILQSVHKEIGDGISFADLVTMARASSYNGTIDVSEDRYFAPESMVAAIESACRESNQAVPQSPGDFARCICRGLASSYAQNIKDLSAITGASYDSINIIGGGSQNAYLNELTAATCGLPVYAGPTEGTALGNIASQMIAHGELSDLNAAREVIRRSFDILEVKA
jgi:rhamnulokinase